MEIAHALDEADDLATTKVEAALYKRALGYTFQEVTEEEKETPLGTTTTTRTVTKQQAPDTKAAIFWLKNRAPDRWGDRTEVEHTMTVMEEQAAERMAVRDTALDQLGLTAAQRAARHWSPTTRCSRWACLQGVRWVVPWCSGLVPRCCSG